MSDAILISPTETKPAMISSALATSIMISPALAQAQSVPTRSLGSPLWDLAGRVPSLDLNFAQNRSLVDATTGLNLITFSRTSDATFVGSNGLIQTASAGTPRFDHSPITSESLGLLNEEQRANLLLRSEEFNDSSWTALALDVTASANQIAAPSGTTTADSIADDATNGAHYLSQSVAVAATTTYTFSCFLRAGTSNFGYLSLSGGATGWGDTFVVNLATGTGGVHSGSFGSTSIQALSNGWYRVAVTKVTTGSGSPQLRVGVAQSLSVVSYAGSGSTIFAWGAQLEAGAFPTSYIPTGASAVTRAADACSISGSNFSSWYRQDEGTVFVSCSVGYTVPGTSFPLAASFTDGTLNNRIEVGFLTYSVASLEVGVSNVNQVAMYPGSTALSRRIAAGYRLDDFGISVNGASANTDTSGSIPTLSRLDIGNRAGGSLPLNGHIRRLVYWRERLANNVLQSITQ